MSGKKRGVAIETLEAMAKHHALSACGHHDRIKETPMNTREPPPAHCPRCDTIDCDCYHDEAAPVNELVRCRVARAICTACDENPDHVGDARGNEYRWQDYLGAADAAILAYREGT